MKWHSDIDIISILLFIFASFLLAPIVIAFGCLLLANIQFIFLFLI